jgi:hypothetical protein
MGLKWWNIVAVEAIAIVTIIMALGYVKLPKFLRKRKLARGFPWGYYPEAVPKADPGFYADNNTDFLHDVGTEFTGIEGFGDYGEFSGFGELGEFGQGFSYGANGSGSGE